MKTVKEIKLQEFGSDNPLSFEDRLKWDWKNFQEAHPEYTVEVKTEKFPFIINVINDLTGEIRVILAKSYDGRFNIKYGWLGQTFDSTNIFDKVLEVMSDE